MCRSARGGRVEGSIVGVGFHIVGAMTLTGSGEPALVTDRVFDSIRDSIMRGELAGGTRLRLRDLAAQLGTSPMPVRDAILRLEQVGLVRRLPHRGAVVANLTVRELLHIYAIRQVLEAEATRTGSAVLSAVDAARMHAAHDLMVRSVADGRLVDALDHDETLLTVLYAADGNLILVGMVHDLWRRCRQYKIANVQAGRETGDLGMWSFQGPLIEAAAAHDVEAAVDLTHRSLQNSTDRLHNLLAAEAVQPVGDR